jgi:hypothetical protein
MYLSQTRMFILICKEGVRLYTNNYYYYYYYHHHYNYYYPYSIFY